MAIDYGATFSGGAYVPSMRFTDPAAGVIHPQDPRFMPVRAPVFRAPGAPPLMGTPLPPRVPAAAPVPEPSATDAVLDDVARYRPDPRELEGLRRGQPSSYLRPLLQTSGTGLSLADVEGRQRAMAVLDDMFGSEEELRPDPMGDAIEARQKTLAYEGLQPYGALSQISARYGGRGPLAGSEIGSEAIGTRLMGEPTRAEEFTLRQQQVRQAPDLLKARAEAGKATAEGRLLHGRSNIAEELLQLREDLTEEVRAGRRSPQEAEALFQRKASEAAVLTDLMKSGVTPRRDPAYGEMED